MKILCSLIFLCVSVVAQSRETIHLVYAFGVGDNIANYYRTLAKAANSSQDKFIFVFDAKPGAGNTVAANYVKSNPNSILGTSPAFFIRPVLYPNESYNISDFVSLMPQCQSPMVVSSVKFKSWEETKSDREYNVGVSGLGVATHLVALQIKHRFPKINIVPYKSTSEAMLGLMTGDIDFQIGFFSQIDAWANSSRRLNVLGITGSNLGHGYPLLIDQGFPLILADMDLVTHMVVPKSMPTAKIKELRTILMIASQDKSVLDAYLIDKCVTMSNLSDNQINLWFQNQTQRYRKLSTGILLQ